MGIYSDLILEQENKKAKQANSVTQRVTSQQKFPQPAQPPYQRKANILNPLKDLSNAAVNVVPQLPQMGVDFVKSAGNNIGAIATHPIQGTADTLASFGRGALSGAVDFVPSVAGLGVDLVNSIAGKNVINMPEERRRPLGYALEQLRETDRDINTPIARVNGNVAPQNVTAMSHLLGSDPLSEKTAFAEMTGQFAVPMGVANQAKNAVTAAKTASKVANESSRIASKLSDAQKLKYAKQVEKLARKNVANNTLPKTTLSRYVDNAATGGGLGMLEGNDLQERLQNGLGGAALGGALTGVHSGVNRALNSKNGVKFRNNVAETFKNLTENYNGVSQAVAGIDNALNTNLSKHASDLTKKRKDYVDLVSKNQNYKRHISDQEKALLDEAGKLSEEQQTEIFERNKYGDRERALRMSKNVKDELENQKKREHKTEVKTQEEADKWFKDREEFKKKLEESKKAFEEQKENNIEHETLPEYKQTEENTIQTKSDLSPVKSQENINTHKQDKTLNTEPTEHIENKKTKLNNQEENIVKFDEEGLEALGKEMQDWLHLSKKNAGKFTKLESGKAEGADSSFYYEQKAKAKTKHLEDDDAYIKPDEDGQYVKEAQGNNYENYVDENYSKSDLFPEDTASLQKEIKAAKVKKDVPTIRSKEKFVPKTEEQINKDNKRRTNDRLENEKNKQSFKQKLKTKIKAIDSDDIADAKSLAELIYENDSKVSGSVPLMKSAITTIKETDKVKPYKGDLPASNKAEFRDPNTFEEVKISKSKEKAETFEERINKIVSNKELNGSKRISEINKTISDNIGLGDYNNVSNNGNRVYSGKRLTVKLKDVIKGDKELERYFKKLGDIDVHIEDVKHQSGRNGAYDYKTNSIKIYSDCPNYYKTLAHEARHAVQHQLASRTWFGSRWRKLFKSCSKRNEEYNNFIKNNDMDVVLRTEKWYNKLSDGSITEQEFVKNVSYDEAKQYVEFFKLRKRYRDAYLEVDARRFADGEHDKRLFHKGSSTIRGELRYGKSKYSGIDKKRYGLSEFGDLDRETRITESPLDNEGRRLEQQEQSSRLREDKQDIKSIQEKVEHNKLINRTLDWFDNTKDKSAKLYKDFKEAAHEIKKFTDAYKTINDKREAFFREFGTYTNERMKARLFKQSESGEGVYFQQGTKRNNKVDWGKESNTKVGFTGKKELEGISEKGTTQQGLARGFSDIVKMEHTRNCINFLKENFSQPQEGYVPVNSKLLANAMYFGKSKAWYETIRKGKEAIDNTFDEKNAKEWKELYDTTEADKSDIYVPKDLLDLSITGEKELPLDYLANYGKVRGTSGRVKGMAKVAGAMLDFYTDRFKRKVLTSASFFANNRFGNQIMLAMTADNPAQYIKGLADAFRLKESEVPTQILESTLAEAIQQEANVGIRKYFSEKNNTFDNIARILDGDEINSRSIGATASNWLISKPNALFRSISKLTGEINEKFERFERKQAFSQTLSKMQKNKILNTARKFAGVHELAKIAREDKLIREAVIDKVADTLGDYNNFSKFERNVLKKIIPFYAWNRTITRHIISMAKDNPVKAVLVAYETYRLLHQDDGLEDYQHGSLKTGLRNNRTKSNVVINKASMIPYNTLFDMASGENIGSISPAITKPLEAIRGEKFFKPASEITSKDWKRTTQDKKQGYINTKTGEFREGKAPTSVRAKYLAKDAYETIYPMSGSPMTKGTVDAVKHYKKTGELLFPDKQYDASLGGFYHGDKAGKYKRGNKTYDRTQSAKNRLDLKYQIANRTLGVGIQPEHKVSSKEQKEKYKRQRSRMKKRKH